MLGKMASYALRFDCLPESFQGGGCWRLLKTLRMSWAVRCPRIEKVLQTLMKAADWLQGSGVTHHDCGRQVWHMHVPCCATRCAASVAYDLLGMCMRR